MAKRTVAEEIDTKLKSGLKAEKKAPAPSASRISNLGDYAHPAKRKKKK